MAVISSQSTLLPAVDDGGGRARQADGSVVVNKFGINPSIAGTEEGVLVAGGSFLYPTTGGVCTVASAGGSTDENVTVKISGLATTTFAELNETVTLDSSGNATSAGSYIRIFRAFRTGTQDVTGVTTLTVDSQQLASFTVAAQQTQQIGFTVPASFTGYIAAWSLTFEKADQGDIAIYTRDNLAGDGFRLRDNMSGTEGEAFRRYCHASQWSGGIRCPEKCDIEMRSIATVGTVTVAGWMQIVLVPRT